MKYLGLMLDFGGVILKTPFEMHRLVEKKLGVANNTLTWYGPFDPDSDLLWIKMQKDEITEQDYWHEKSKLVGKLAGENWNLRDYMTCCYHGFEENDIIRKEAVTTIRKVKDHGFSVGILTNEIEYFHGRVWMDELNILKDCQPLSTEYSYLLEKLQQFLQQLNILLKKDKILFLFLFSLLLNHPIFDFPLLLFFLHTFLFH